MQDKFKLNPLKVSHLSIVDLAGLTSETIIVGNIALPSFTNPLLVTALNALIQTDSEFRVRLITAKGSPITVIIQENDEERDDAFSEIVRTANTASKSSNMVNGLAGKKLVEFLSPYHDVQKEPLMSETSTFNYMQGQYYGDTNVQNAAITLQLDPVFMRLFNANAQVSALWNQRAEEEAAKSGPSPTSLRNNLEKSYYDFCEVTLQTLNLTPSPQLENLVYVMNEIRIKYAKAAPVKLTDKNTSVKPIPTQTYTGQAITPIPTVLLKTEDGKEKELRFTVDFYITYKNNIQVGEAKLIVHGKGKYGGSYVSTFHIEN